MLARAVMHAILAIGEVASRTSDAGRGRAPAVPWAQIVGMRNRLVHAYFDINRNILWDTVHRSLPMLIAQLKAATASE